MESTGGGVGRHVIDLANGLDHTGREVHLIYSARRMEEGFRRELEKLDRISTRKIDMQRAPHLSDIAAVFRIRSYIAKHGAFDVIHGHSSKGGALARLAAAGLPSSCIYTPHAFRTMDPLLHSVARWLYKMIERCLCFLTDAVILVSDDEKKHAISLGLPLEKLYVVPNGIAPEALGSRNEARLKLQFGEDKVYIGFVGRLAPQKSPETLVEGFSKIVYRFDNARLVMLGNGPLSEKLRKLAEQLGVRERIIWLQDMSGSALMPALDIFVMPSRYEGFPYVLLEAAAADLPIIATPVGGTRAIVKNEENGFVVPIGRVDMLKQAMTRLLEDSTLRRKMGQTSGDIVRPFTIGAMVDKTLKVYETASKLYQENAER